jgi:RNA polymerase sigma factor (sigma-70 family)
VSGSAAGGAREEWIAAVAKIRASSPAGDALKSPHLGRLYELAVADGPKLLASFRRRLGDDRILDLIHDLLAAKVEAIVNADEPRALFCTALQRRAISWLRRGDAAVVEDPEEEDSARASEEAEDERRGFILDARNVLSKLPDRERAMVVAVALGEDREAIAKTFGTSRANVDQIVSRVRKKLSSAESES